MSYIYQTHKICAVSTWFETRGVWLNISPWLNSWAAFDLFAVLLFEDKVTSCPHFGWKVGMLNWSWLSSNLFETLLLVVAILQVTIVVNAPSKWGTVTQRIWQNLHSFESAKKIPKLERYILKSVSIKAGPIYHVMS